MKPAHYSYRAVISERHGRQLLSADYHSGTSIFTDSGRPLSERSNRFHSSVIWSLPPLHPQTYSNIETFQVYTACLVLTDFRASNANGGRPHAVWCKLRETRTGFCRASTGYFVGSLSYVMSGEQPSLLYSLVAKYCSMYTPWHSLLACNIA